MICLKTTVQVNGEIGQEVTIFIPESILLLYVQPPNEPRPHTNQYFLPDKYAADMRVQQVAEKWENLFILRNEIEG